MDWKMVSAARRVSPALALACVFAAGSAMAAVRSSSPALKISPKGATSIASAAAAAPASGASTEADSLRKPDREAKQEEMLNKLLKARRATLSTFARAAIAAIPLPHVQGLRLSDGDESAFGFKGLSNVDQASVNLGFSVEPPDQMLCAGNGFIFEGVNDAFAVYGENGGLLAGPAQANAFFNVDFSLNVSDPRCIYDSASNRWFVTMLEYPNTLDNNHLKLAVSQTGDPTGAFNIYDIDVTGDGADFFPGDCPCYGDQPLIGADASGFYISTNAFGLSSFQGAQVYVLSKAALAAGLPTPVVHFDQLSSSLPGIEFSFSIHPSTTPPGAHFAADTEFLAQSMRANTQETGLAVWTVNNTSLIDSTPSSLTMSLALTPSQSYVTPVPAEQKAGSTPRAETAAISNVEFAANEQDLDGNDQRLQQVTYLNGQLWTALGTASVDDGTPVRDAAAWFVVNVSNPANTPTANVVAQGYVAGPGSSHLIYPALAVNAHGEAAMVFTLSGPKFFPSAAFWKVGGQSIHMLFEGKAAEDGFSAYVINRPRWGDYSAAAVGPDGSIWMATEMIPGGFRKKSANWGTFVARTHRGAQDD
jgi:hypothetical protein